MRQLFNTREGLQVLEVPNPTPEDNELLVAVYNSVISTGTETMGMRKGEMSFAYRLQEKKALIGKVNKVINEKGLLSAIKAFGKKISPSEQISFFSPVGYSNAGIVVAKGRLVKGFNMGDRVACAGAGIASHAEFVAVPVNLAVKIPNDVTFESAGFTTIGSISMQGIRRANVTFGETIVIMGLGLLGLIAVQIAKAWGLVVIGVDIIHDRLKLASELGADYCFEANDKLLISKIKNVTNENGADAVIIYAATNQSRPANLAMEACRKKGRVVIVGSVGMNLQREQMYLKELDFVMSTSYGPGRYDSQYELKGIDYPIGYVRWTENRNMMEFVRLLETKRVNVERLITGRYSLEQASVAYTDLVSRSNDNIACIFIYKHEQQIIIKSRLENQPHVILPRKIGVGIIGAGSFIQKNHLANILQLPEIFQVIGIAEKTPASARAVMETYKVQYVTTDYSQLLDDPNIELIVIGTRHNLHADQVIDAINAGKHVLVEKPLAMTREELSRIEEVIDKGLKTVAAVGFNRRYSPLVQKALEIIKSNDTPIVINYRVNAGYFSPDVWVQDLEEGGGRIIGEVCHFIDLIAYLADSQVKEIYSVHISPDGKNIQSEDNLALTMKFHNESIGILTYTSIGGKDMEKERLEIYTNGYSLVINDFMELRIYNHKEKSIKLKQTDKGHKAIIVELSKKLLNQKSLILPFERDIETTRHTLSILDQIHGNSKFPS